MTDRLRVAVTLEQCWHDVPGGTARAALELVDALDERPDHDVEVIGVSARHSAPPAPAFRPSVPVRQVPLPRLALYEAWHWLRQPTVERTTGPIDVVHATGIALAPSRRPVVTTLHDLAFLRFPELYTRRGNQFFRRALELTRRHADAVLCSSHQTLDDAANAGIDTSLLHHVPLGVHAVRATPEARAAIRSRHGIDRPFVLWTGTREPRKNLARLVEAYRRSDHHHDVDLVLVGPAGWHAEQTGLDGDPPSGVRVLGFVPSDELAALYAECAVFCFPSLLEGFGLPVLEAMAQGAPVITSRGTATEEVAEGNAALIDPTDTDELVAALDSLLDDDDRRNHMAQTGPAVASRYPWSAHADRTVEIYRSLVG